MMNCENKAGFISALESALMMYSREKITGLEYRRIGQAAGDAPAMEEVVISFGSGYTKAVDITGDSCIAIMHDLWRALQ